MYGLLEVLEDGRGVNLLFKDKEQAENFTLFAHTYIAESGAGNGYGAYWHFRDNPIIGVDTKTGRGNLNTDLVRAMALSICDARTARPPAWNGGNVTEPEYMPLVEVEDDAITFSFDADKLPPRIQPETGNLVRIVDNPEHSRQIARVKEVRGENVALIHCPYSHIEKDEELEIPLNNVMKINDFLNGE